MARIKSASPDDLMPPPDSGKQLSEEQITLLERWIQQGLNTEIIGRMWRRVAHPCRRSPSRMDKQPNRHLHP